MGGHPRGRVWHDFFGRYASTNVAVFRRRGCTVGNAQLQIDDTRVSVCMRVSVSLNKIAQPCFIGACCSDVQRDARAATVLGSGQRLLYRAALLCNESEMVRHI